VSLARGHINPSTQQNMALRRQLRCNARFIANCPKLNDVDVCPTS